MCVQVKNAMFEYGRHLGLAFQVVDDILDFTTHADLLGKPQVSTFCIRYEYYCYEKWAVIQFSGSSQLACYSKTAQGGL